jgi:hypothetical protein
MRIVRLRRKFTFLWFGLGWGAMLLACALSLVHGPRQAEAGPLAQPSARPTIDLTATAAAHASPTAPGPVPTTGGGGTSVAASPTAALPTATPRSIQPTRTSTTVPSTVSPTQPPPTATPWIIVVTATSLLPTEPPASPTPLVIVITATPGPGGAMVGTALPLTAQPASDPATPNPAGWWLWVLILSPIVMLAVALWWLRGRGFFVPALYPPRGRPRRGGVLSARRRLPPPRDFPY